MACLSALIVPTLAVTVAGVGGGGLFRCITCPDCMVCNWHPLTNESAVVVYDPVDQQMKEPYRCMLAFMRLRPDCLLCCDRSRTARSRYMVKPGYGMADPALALDLATRHELGQRAPQMRIDLIRCPGGELSCPGFELRLPPDERAECNDEYSGLLCATCFGPFISVNNKCISCPGVNWSMIFSALLTNLVMALFMLHKSTKAAISATEIRHVWHKVLAPPLFFFFLSSAVIQAKRAVWGNPTSRDG